MELNILNWAILSDTKNQNLRDNLCDEDYARGARKFIDAVNGLLQEELMRITTDGQSRADMFWRHNKLMRSTKGRGCFGTRVRLLNGCFVAEWYENIFVKRTGDKPLSKYISKGRDKDRYSNNSFKKANLGWEKGLIDQVENEYEKLRIQEKFIYELRKILKKYQRVINDIYGEQT